jgi:hypothetical protein
MEITLSNGSKIETINSGSSVRGRVKGITDIFTVTGIEHLEVVPLVVGTKIECNEDILNRLRDEPYISNNFKLNIKKLDDSWYSVYFDAKQHS